jgi:hypothetical protein
LISDLESEAQIINPFRTVLVHGSLRLLLHLRPPLLRSLHFDSGYTKSPPPLKAQDDTKQRIAVKIVR